MSIGEDLAQRFERANADAITAVEQCSAEKWGATCPAEGWTAAALAHHVATGHEQILGLVQAIAAGADLPPLTQEMFDTSNAEHAQQFAKADKQETLQILRDGGANAAAGLRALSDDQLAKTKPVMGMDMSVQQAAEMILIGHVDQHMSSFKDGTA